MWTAAWTKPARKWSVDLHFCSSFFWQFYFLFLLIYYLPKYNFTDILTFQVYMSILFLDDIIIFNGMNFKVVDLRFPSCV